MKKLKLVSALTTASVLAGLLFGCAAERECGLRGCAGDAHVTTNVRSLLDEHPEVGTQVNVQTLDHVVYLSGFVSAGEMKATAEDVARTVPGVSKVVNSVSVTH